jgi:ubiquinone/menaquinone biosynthesis C-methylase UbiE
LSYDPDPRWEAFAAREPYFAVLTSPDYLRANLTSAHERKFFESGEELVTWMLYIIEQRMASHFSPMSTLEYGCGVGRLAIPFAQRPGAVLAVDRSPSMLAAARQNAEKAGAGHIEFRAPRELFGSARRFDLVSCFHVLQRLGHAEGLTLLRELTGRIATGGVGIFHVPYRSSASSLIQASRWARERVPILNSVANMLSGKPSRDPIIPSHVYDLDETLQVLDAAGVPAAHVVFEHQQELSSAIIFAQVPLPSTTGVDERGRPLPGTTLRVRAREGDVHAVDVRELIANASIDDLNRAAEQYFATLTDAEDQLAKPFSNTSEAPALLASLAALLHGLRLFVGATVLEFGAGTGWLSRCLTQLGCRVILLDVSATALRMAEELYQRVPVIGDRPVPQFVVFDGRRLNLPDGSVDRVLTFDAFHHVPNPDEVLAEFARILKPGGIAGFAEPGARHSRAPMSQFEMRTYGVVENDIDVHAIWRMAQRCGFCEVKLGVLQGPPFYLSLQEYEDFLAGGQTTERWLTSARVFLRDVLHFFLFKEGSEGADSRSISGLSCEIDVTLVSQPAQKAKPLVVDADVKNTGTATWLVPGNEVGGVKIGAHLYDAFGKLLNFDFHTEPLTDPPREIAPGESVRCRVTLPGLTVGQYRLEFDCVASRVTWFSQVGSRAVTILVSVT